MASLSLRGDNSSLEGVSLSPAPFPRLPGPWDTHKERGSASGQFAVAFIMESHLDLSSHSLGVMVVALCEPTRDESNLESSIRGCTILPMQVVRYLLGKQFVCGFPTTVAKIRIKR